MRFPEIESIEIKKSIISGDLFLEVTYRFPRTKKESPKAMTFTAAIDSSHLTVTKLSLYKAFEDCQKQMLWEVYHYL